MRESARKTAEQKADWKKNFGKLLEVYEKVSSLRAYGKQSPPM
jgi:hypothetical protein